MFFSELPKWLRPQTDFFFQQTCLLDINDQEKVQYLTDTMLSSPFFEQWLELHFMVLNQNLQNNLKKNEKIEKTNNFFSKIFSTRNEEQKRVSFHKL